MRIAFFHNLPTGGAKKVVYEQIKYLSRKHEIDVFKINSQEQALFETDEFSNKIYTYSFNVSRKTGIINRISRDYKNFVSLKLLQKKIAQEIDSKKYDICIVHPDKFTQTPFILTFLKTRSIYFCEEWLRIVYEKEYAFTEKVSIDKRIYETITRWIRKKIDYNNMQHAQNIIANSQFTANNIENAYHKKAEVLLLGVDSQLYHPLTIKKEYDLLFIGEKTVQEGYELLKKAQEEIKKELIIKVLSRKNNKLHLTDEDVVKELNKAKIVLALSYNEPFGLIPLEAMACATPVIAIDEGGYKETIKNEKTGYLVPRDQKKLANQIETLLKQNEKRKELGNNARKDMEENWTWKKHGEKLEKIINKIKYEK